MGSNQSNRYNSINGWFLVNKNELWTRWTSINEHLLKVSSAFFLATPKIVFGKAVMNKILAVREIGYNPLSHFYWRNRCDRAKKRHFHTLWWKDLWLRVCMFWTTPTQNANVSLCCFSWKLVIPSWNRFSRNSNKMHYSRAVHSKCHSSKHAHYLIKNYWLAVLTAEMSQTILIGTQRLFFF